MTEFQRITNSPEALIDAILRNSHLRVYSNSEFERKRLKEYFEREAD